MDLVLRRWRGTHTGKDRPTFRIAFAVVLLAWGPLSTAAAAQALTAADSASLARAAAATVITEVLSDARGFSVELLAPTSRFDSLVARHVTESGQFAPVADHAQVVQVGTRGLYIVSDTPAVMIEVTRCDGRGTRLSCWSSLDSYAYARDGARWKHVQPPPNGAAP